jgi:hypothetical protein
LTEIIDFVRLAFYGAAWIAILYLLMRPRSCWPQCLFCKARHIADPLRNPKIAEAVTVVNGHATCSAHLGVAIDFDKGVSLKTVSEWSASL